MGHLAQPLPTEGTDGLGPSGKEERGAERSVLGQLSGRTEAFQVPKAESPHLPCPSQLKKERRLGRRNRARTSDNYEEYREHSRGVEMVTLMGVASTKGEKGGWLCRPMP